MRVTCPQCAESYAVSDEKLGGRVVQIRCRQCQTPMVLDGRSSIPPAPRIAPQPVAPRIAPRPVAPLTAAVGSQTNAAPASVRPSLPPPRVRNAATPGSAAGPASSPPSWDTPAPSLHRRPSTPPPSLHSTLLGALQVPKAQLPTRATLDSIDVELDADEAPPTARSTRFPPPPTETPARHSAPPSVAVLQANGAAPPLGDPPPLPRLGLPANFGPFSPTPSSGNAFPWLTPSNGPSGQPASLRPEPHDGIPSSLSAATRTPTGMHYPSRPGVPGAPFGQPPPLPKQEDEDTLAMTRQELMAAADRTTDPRTPFLGRSPTMAPRRAPVVEPPEQDDRPTPKNGSSLLLLLLFGAVLGGGGVWLKGRAEGSAVAANLSLARASEPAPATDFDGDLVRAQRDAARCLGKSARLLHVRFTLQNGAPGNLQLSGTVLAATEEECVRHAFNSLRATSSANRTIDCDVNPEPTL